MDTIAPANAEAIEAWNGVLFDRFVEYRHLLTFGLGAHGDRALELHPPRPGAHVLDVGCGFGDTTQRLGEMVGPEGSAHGVDASERFIELAAAESEQAGAPNVTFAAADVQASTFESRFDYAFSRFGTMFFAAPVPALRNVRAALVPGGRLCMVVWRRKLDNEWMHRAELVVKAHEIETEGSDEPTCGPGPFSMADADTTSAIVLAAGFEDVEFSRCDRTIMMGRSLDEAIGLTMALGPAGEVLRLAGDRADHLREVIAGELREALAEFDRPEGVIAPASTWIVSATVPA